MIKSESKSLLRVVKQMRKEGETWEKTRRHLNRNRIKTVRGLAWTVPNLQAWFYKQAQTSKRPSSRKAA